MNNCRRRSACDGMSERTVGRSVASKNREIEEGGEGEGDRERERERERETETETETERQR